jgi:hypothetical protein
MKSRRKRTRVQRSEQQVARNRVAEPVAETATPAPVSGPNPTLEAEAPSRRKLPHPTDPRRWADGTQRPGADGIARVWPKVETDDPTVARHLAGEVERIIEDRGGRDHLSTINERLISRIAALGLFLEHWEQFFLRAGIHTKHGRVRAGFVQGYLSTLDRYTRLAQLIGVTRETRPVRLSTRQWLEGDEPHDDGPTDETSQIADPNNSTEARDGASAPSDQH